MSKQAYRTELEIISDILQVIMERGIHGEHITSIARNANLSHNTALVKCQKLINGGLVTVSKSKKSQVFVITEDGIKFYRELINFTDLARHIKEGKDLYF
ncbi:MAG: transcriptional regulator [Thaumarchaeota archaeon]|nr:transcriptional regulator [Nitrososphaerota archaeon]MDE1841450.1 transcriptional regulator [Nitrososphaerota archaeon]